MLCREIGRPAQTCRETLFDVPLILEVFGFAADCIPAIGPALALTTLLFSAP